MGIKDTLQKVIDEVASYDTEYFRDKLLNLDAQGLLIVGGIAAFIVILCLLKKMVRTATLIVSSGLLIVILRYTIPPKGEPFGFQQLVGLLVGCTFIVAVTIYVCLIRSD